jgi:hypothetical protein
MSHVVRSRGRGVKQMGHRQDKDHEDGAGDGGGDTVLDHVEGDGAGSGEEEGASVEEGTEVEVGG